MMLTETVEVKVSIHAPARGATLNNSRVFKIDVFQSTHPRGVRHGSSKEWTGGAFVSIHAPARGATYARLYIDQGTRYSPQIANLIA